LFEKLYALKLLSNKIPNILAKIAKLFALNQQVSNIYSASANNKRFKHSTQNIKHETIKTCRPLVSRLLLTFRFQNHP